MKTEYRTVESSPSTWLFQVSLALGVMFVGLDIVYTTTTGQGLDESGYESSFLWSGLAFMIAMAISCAGASFSSPPSTVRQILTALIVVGIAVWTGARIRWGISLVPIPVTDWWLTSGVVAVFWAWQMVDWIVQRGRRRLLALCGLAGFVIGYPLFAEFGFESPLLYLLFLVLLGGGAGVWVWYSVPHLLGLILQGMSANHVSELPSFRPSEEQAEEPPYGRIWRIRIMISTYAANRRRRVEVCNHLSNTEKQEWSRFAAQYGAWAGVSFAVPLSVVGTLGLAWPIDVAIVVVTLVIHITGARRLRKKAQRLLASTDWAKSQGYRPEDF